MGAFAMKGHLDLGYAHAGHTGKIDIRRVHHHGCINTVEGAFLRHQLLAAAFFFRRRTQVTNTTGQTGAELRKSDRRPKADGGNNIVAAGVTNTG